MMDFEIIALIVLSGIVLVFFTLKIIFMLKRRKKCIENLRTYFDRLQSKKKNMELFEIALEKYGQLFYAFSVLQGLHYSLITSSVFFLLMGFVALVSGSELDIFWSSLSAMLSLFIAILNPQNKCKKCEKGWKEIERQILFNELSAKSVNSVEVELFATME